jgi:O-antigen/teichoic acid export membrane protein
MYLLLDLVVFSSANFILTIALGRLYSASEFGSYGIGLAVALAVQFIQRNLYIVSLSLMSRRVAARLSRGILAEHLTVAGTTLLIAMLLTCVMAVTGAGHADLDVALSTLVCGIIYFQSDFDRAMQVKRGSYRGALALSIVYLIIVITIAVLAKVLDLSFIDFMMSLGLIFSLRSLWLCLLHIRPHWSWGIRLLRRDWRRYGVPALIQAGSFAGGQHLPLIVLATFGGSAQVGGLIAMRSLSQPLSVVFRSLDAGDKNRFRLASGGSTAGARRVFWRTVAFYGAISVGAIVILSIFRDQIIAFAYHGKYSGLGGVMIGWTVYAAMMGITFPIQSLIYLLHRQRFFTGWIMASGAFGVALSILLCDRFGMMGAMTATLLSLAVNALGGLIVVRDVIAGRKDVPLPKELSSGRFANQALLKSISRAS